MRWFGSTIRLRHSTSSALGIRLRRLDVQACTLLAAIGLACRLAVPAAGAVIGDPRKPHDDLPEDKARAYVELVTESPQDYEINMAGTVDGAMTRSPVGYAPFTQGWQPNRSVLIENLGRSDVRNPQLVVGGKRNWRTLEDVVAEATAGCRGEADRARAIWEFRRRHRFHACTWDDECSDALKSINVYGYTLCGNEARAIHDLWQVAGLDTRRGYPIGHVVTEVFYGGRYHLMDSDEHVICLLHDNRTIASAADVVRDHDLVKRTHTYGILRRDGRQTDEFSASLYVYEGKREGDFNPSTRPPIDWALRPGESIEFRWDHVGKHYSAGRPWSKGEPARDGLGDLRRFGPQAYDCLRNGKLRYRPDLSGPLTRQGAEEVENAAFDLQSAAIRPVDPARPAAITWRFASPWVLVGGVADAAVELQPGGSADWRYSTDGKRWTTLGPAKTSASGSLSQSLDEVLSPRKQPTYEFRLRLALGGKVTVKSVRFDTDFQIAPLALPELEVGVNRVVYHDESTAGRQVRVTHHWLERTAWHPPATPAEALAPQDGQTVEGSRVAFRWTPAEDADDDRIVDYHFELSDRADMRWPLSPNFEKLVSLTPSKGKAEWTVPYVGLLNPETDYFWHVCARDASGVWGPWSRTFRFRIRSPGVPLDVTLAPAGEGRLTLHWKPNPLGEPPVAYKVYGSNERGFSVSDVPYVVFRGKGFVRSMEEYETKPAGAPDAGAVETPANLIGRVGETSLAVVGPEVKLPNANTAYYRVVAVDASGAESGPSDYAEVPRPFVVNLPPSTAVAGKPYEFRPLVIRSLGDLRVRRSEKSSYNAAFWDREDVTFRATALPGGLSLDPQTGAIVGMPSEAGSFDLAFEVTDQFGNSQAVAGRLTVRTGE